jgi:hypothetical protein
VGGRRAAPAPGPPFTPGGGPSWIAELATADPEEARGAVGAGAAAVAVRESSLGDTPHDRAETLAQLLLVARREP